ncbi:hypothetical protein WAI453_007164 [Rhynchosporium graminicola]
MENDLSTVLLFGGLAVRSRIKYTNLNRTGVQDKSVEPLILGVDSNTMPLENDLEAA